MAYQDYGQRVGLTNTMITGSGTATTQPVGEIVQKMEYLDKALHELQEEAVGIGGTFAAVLRPLGPQPGDVEGGRSAVATASHIADTLESFASRVMNAVYVLREIRLRCDL